MYSSATVPLRVIASVLNPMQPLKETLSLYSELMQITRESMIQTSRVRLSVPPNCKIASTMILVQPPKAKISYAYSIIYSTPT